MEEKIKEKEKKLVIKNVKKRKKLIMNKKIYR
jgi:hypothetical protein